MCLTTWLYTFFYKEFKKILYLFCSFNACKLVFCLSYKIMAFMMSLHIYFTLLFFSHEYPHLSSFLLASSSHCKITPLFSWYVCVDMYIYLNKNKKIQYFSFPFTSLATLHLQFSFLLIVPIHFHYIYIYLNLDFTSERTHRSSSLL